MDACKSGRDKGFSIKACFKLHVLDIFIAMG